MTEVDSGAVESLRGLGGSIESLRPSQMCLIIEADHYPKVVPGGICRSLACEPVAVSKEGR